MRKQLLISLLVIGNCLTGYSQDWWPYQPGQVSFFETIGPLSGDTLTIRRSLGHVLQRNGYSVAYFHQGFQDGCQADQVSVQPQFLSFDLDSLILYPDRFVYIVRGDSLVYHHLIAEGDSFTIPNWGDLLVHWELDSIRITLDSVATHSFLGLTDSARFFSLQGLENGVPVTSDINQQRIILSKHHGFIEYLSDIPWQLGHPLRPLAPSHSWLIGLSDDSLEIGFQDFKPVELISLQPGDILKWKEEQVDFVAADTTVKWFRDSLLSTQTTDSTFDYTYHRTTREPDGTIATAVLSETINTKTLAASMKGNSNYTTTQLPDWLTSPSIDIGLVSTWEKRLGELQINHAYTGLFMDSGVCQIHQLTDIHMEHGYRKGVGTYYLHRLGLTGEYTLALVGYRLGQTTFGDYGPLGAPRTYNYQPLILYPNPVSSYVVLDLPQHTLQTGIIIITDLHGRMILNQALSGNASVSLPELSLGVYLLSVVGSDTVYQTKLMVR